MKYVALLRGINVGGNSVIKMASLKEAVEACGFKNVRTYIQSGNVVFESGDNAGETAKKLENCLLKKLGINSSVILKTREQLDKVISEIPAEWGKVDLRCYIAFVKEPVTAEEVLAETQPKQGVDFVKSGHGVLYMSTLLSGITKTGFTKLITKKVYSDITIRNYTTVKKLLEFMERS